MPSGTEFINKIDTILNEFHLTRKDLGLQLNLSSSTLSTWKSSTSLPSGDNIYKIAKYLEVSADWLITEENDFEARDNLYGEQSRNNIRLRIYKLLGKKFGDQDSRFNDNYLSNEETIEELHNHYFPPAISYRYFYNWSKGRCEIPIDIFQQWSFTFNTSLDYIFTGSKKKAPNIFDNPLYELAEKFRYQLYALGSYSEERKNHAAYFLDELFKQQVIENEKNKDKK